MIYGQNIANCGSDDRKPDPVGLDIAWTGHNPFATKHGFHLHLYKVTWENPQPTLPVESISFRSELAVPAPFLIALTAE